MIADNIRKFYLFKIAWMFWLVWAIDVVFYRSNNLSVTQISVIGVVWAVSAFLLEVPTGIIADRWSRKYMLVLSSLFAALGFLIFSLNSAFFPFAVATIFMAARFSFASGTANALLYDSLKTINRESEFEKVLGRSNFLGMLGVSLAGAIGSYLAATDIRLPYYLSGGVSLIAAAIATSFIEPKIHTSTQEAKLFDHIAHAIKDVINSQFIRFLPFYLIFMDIAITFLDEYDQLYLTAINFPLVFFGVWIALRRGLGGAGGFLAEKFKGRFDDFGKLLVLLVMILALVTISFGSSYLGLAAFLLIFPIWGASEVLISGELHSQIESSKRATIESLTVFLNTFISAPIILLFGQVSDFYGIRGGYLFTAGLLFLYLPFFFLGAAVKDKIAHPLK